MGPGGTQIQFLGLLEHAYSCQDLPCKGGDSTADAQTGIGIDEARRLLFLAVGERISPSRVLHMLADLGARDGILFDGGGSSGATAGAEWSQAWGSVEQECAHTFYSRIAAFLPVKSILEIATGYGRWTRFLLQQWQWRSDRAALAAYHLNGEHDQHGWN